MAPDSRGKLSRYGVLSWQRMLPSDVSDSRFPLWVRRRAQPKNSSPSRTSPSDCPGRRVNSFSMTEELQSVVDEVARYTSIAIRIEDEAIKSKKITGVLQIGNVDLMLEGIEGALGVRVNRVSPELVSLSAG